MLFIITIFTVWLFVRKLISYLVLLDVIITIWLYPAIPISYIITTTNEYYPLNVFCSIATGSTTMIEMAGWLANFEACPRGF